MNSELCLWLAESCVCSGPRTKPKELEEIGIHARTIEQDLQTDSGNGNGSTYKIKQLFNKHGYNLAILRGHVKGIRDAFDPKAVLQLIPLGVGEVRVQGLESGLYLAMNSKGNMYAEPDDTNEATIFLESSSGGYYLNYLSKKYAHLGWYVGITKEGRAKNGKKTFYPWGQKAIQFVSRKAYDEPHPLRQIKNRHGQTLAIMNNGEVRGVAEEAPANKNAVLEFIPTEPPGAYRIRGIQANLFLAMDAKGKLYGESDRTEGSTIFAQHTQNKGQYYVYLSAKFAHHGWHVGLTKAGKPKRGKRTAYGQKAIQFIRKPILPVPLNSPTGTPSNGLFDNQGQPVGGEDLAFIDDEEIEEEQGPGAFMLSKGPTQVRTIT